MDAILDAAQLRQALVSYRKAHKLSREEFAELHDLSPNWVMKFEQGEIVQPKLDRAIRLTEILREAA